MKCEKWTEKEIKILSTFYLDHTAQECIDEFALNRTVKAIQKKARELGIKKKQKWTNDEIESLKYHWAHSDMKTLLNAFPTRNYNSLMNKARSLKIKSEINRKRIGSLEFLDKLSPQSSYWWGFIMADGHLSPTGELCVTLSAVDEIHLKKLSEHLKCPYVKQLKKGGFSRTKTEYVYLRIQDFKFKDKWYEILHYVNPKTYNPPKLDVFYTKELLIKFLIGLIDGDGSIWVSNKTETSKGYLALRIEVHHNWEETFRELFSKVFELYGIKFNIKTTNRGYIKAEIASKTDFQKLLTYVKDCDFLERKWNKAFVFMSKSRPPHV